VHQLNPQLLPGFGATASAPALLAQAAQSVSSATSLWTTVSAALDSANRSPASCGPGCTANSYTTVAQLAEITQLVTLAVSAVENALVGCPSTAEINSLIQSASKAPTYLQLWGVPYGMVSLSGSGTPCVGATCVDTFYASSVGNKLGAAQKLVSLAQTQYAACQVRTSAGKIKLRG